MAEASNSSAPNADAPAVETIDPNKHIAVDKKDFVKGIMAKVGEHLLPRYGKEEVPASKVEQILHAALDGYEIVKKLKSK